MNTPQIGDPFTASCWFMPGGKKNAKHTILDGLQQVSDEHGVRFGYVRWSEMNWDDPGVPDPPTHMARGCKVLQGEAKVIGFKPQLVQQSFIADLDPKDLAWLRSITRAAHRKDYPAAPALTDEQCDAIIEEIGPTSAMNALREAVDNKRLN